MIFILHGDNSVFLRDLLFKLQLKVGVDSRIEKEINALTASELLILGSTFDIFGSPPFIVLDVSKTTVGDKNSYIEALKAIPTQTNIVLISNKSLPKNSVWIKNLSSAKIFENNIQPDSNVFKMLDNLFVKNKQETYKELHKLLLEGNDPFYIFSMIHYSLRNICSIKFESPSALKMQPFVKSKFEKQSKLFTQDKLLSYYDYYMDLDKKVKTGQINADSMLTLAVEKVFQ